MLGNRKGGWPVASWYLPGRNHSDSGIGMSWGGDNSYRKDAWFRGWYFLVVNYSDCGWQTRIQMMFGPSIFQE